MKKIEWYVRRALSMAPSEILFRLRFEGKKLIWRFQARRTEHWTAKWAAIKSAPVPWQVSASIRGREVDLLLSELEKHLAHEWLFFGLRGHVEPKIDWHQDPFSKKSAPRQFAFSIDHKNEVHVGNIKTIWEKNRHHHLTFLAVGYFFTKDERYAHEIVNQITDWIEQNPYLIGVNWTSPLEAGIRLISWVWCERLLRESVYYSDFFGKESNFWNSVYRHQLFIEEAYSRGSSANNHLIGEMAGLFIASQAWPWFDKSTNWSTLSQNILELEIQKQTFPSGVNKELAFSYHIFSLEFFILSLYEAQFSSNKFSNKFKDTLAMMLKVIPKMTDYGRNLPNFGDSDEGMAIQLQPSYHRRDDWLLQVGDSLLGTKTNYIDNPSLPLLIMNLPFSRVSDAAHLEDTTSFEDAGIFILTSHRNTDEELFVMADAGPLGFLSIAAHGHADALSFVMSYGGIPFFIDPGTYVYHTEYNWREYFKGTTAHNTISINNRDQSESAGAFLWTRKANCFVEKWDSKSKILSGSHDGYEKSFGIIHNRTFELTNSHLLVTDQLRGNSVLDVEMRYHLHPDCKVVEVGTGYLIKNNNRKLVLEIPQEMNHRLAIGEKNAGWYSPHFEKKVKSPTIILNKSNVNCPQVFKTIIKK